MHNHPGFLELFRLTVARHPYAIAVIDGSHHLSYQEIDRLSNQVACNLIAHKAGHGSNVGICMRRGSEMLVVLLAVVKAGAAYVPLDPGYPRGRLGAMAREGGFACIVSDQDSMELAGGLGAAVLPVTQLLSPRDSAPVGLESNELLDHALTYILFTSGSTGVPKGVAMPYGALSNLIRWQLAESSHLPAHSRTLQFTSLNFDVSFQEIFSTWAAGGSLVTVSEETRRDPELLALSLKNFGINRLFLPFVALQGLLECVISAGHSLPELRQIITAGEQLRISPAIRQFFRQHPVCELHNHYGPSETHVVTAYKLDSAPDEWPDLPPIGYSLPNVELYIVDEMMRRVAPGVTGELLIGGAALAQGYYGRLELTNERFISNPFSGSKGSLVYRTGDLVRANSNGCVEFVGRRDDQVKIRGYRIELGEIEAVLASHPSVKDVAVLAREEVGGARRIIAYLILRQVALDKVERSGLELERWRDMWNQVYENSGGTAPDPALNLAGWNSSYDQQPLPESHMIEWVDHICRRILEAKPRRVLELGCGVGLILFRVAPHCEHYVGTDIAESGLDYIRGVIRHGSSPVEKVLLRNAAADQLLQFKQSAIDCLVLNSVTQHFPNPDYLMQVIRDAIELMNGRGTIFIGDVTNLELREVFFTSVEFSKATDETLAVSLAERISRRLALERDLVIAPGFFSILPSLFPHIPDVEVQLKRGEYGNELRDYRYDVVLHLGKPVARTNRPAVLHWEKDINALRELQSLLGRGELDYLLVAGVPNGRLSQDTSVHADLKGKEGLSTVGDIRARLEARSMEGFEPESFWALEKEHPYKVNVTWSRDGRGRRFDVLFRKIGAHENSLPLPALVEVEAGGASLDLYFSQPWKSVENDAPVATLREHVARILPEYMMPSAFVLLEKFPLTGSGKVDRRALPSPNNQRPNLETPFVSPESPLERQIAAIWMKLLNLQEVGVNDNFFDLGGNSLLAVNFVLSAKQQIGLKIPITRLFQNPTIRMLSRSPRGEETTLNAGSRISARVERQRAALARRQQLRRAEPEA